MAVKKRRVDWGEEDSEEDLFALQTAVECEALGSGQLVQVLASVRRLRARFRTTCPYFVSKTLVYDELVGGGEGATGASTTSTPHGLSATDVDVGLEQLKQKKVLTALYMPGIGDFAIIETDEYREIVRRVSQEREGDNGLQRAIRFFQEEIVGEHHGPTFQIPKSSTMTEHMDMLVKHELLIRMPVGKNAPGIDGFAFKVPGSGRGTDSNVCSLSACASNPLLSRNGRSLVRQWSGRASTGGSSSSRGSRESGTVKCSCPRYGRRSSCESLRWASSGTLPTSSAAASSMSRRRPSANSSASSRRTDSESDRTRFKCL